MGSAYKNDKDIDLFRNDLEVVYTVHRFDKPPIYVTVKWIKEHIGGVIGVLKCEQRYSSKYKRLMNYIPHRTNKSKGRLFELYEIPTKIKQKSELFTFDLRIFTKLGISSYEGSLFPPIGKAKTDYRYTKQDLYNTIDLVKEFSYLPNKSNGNSLSKDSLIKDLKDGMGAVEIQNKYKIGSNRGAITDVCFHIKVATSDKLDLLTDAMKDEGVCRYTLSLYRCYPNYFKIKQ